MQLNHHIGAQLTKYLFIACGSSAIVQLSALWAPLKWALGAIALLTFVLFLALFTMQINGITRGYHWAQHFTFEASTVGILQFSAFVSAIAVGGLVTWIAIF